MWTRRFYAWLFSIAILPVCLLFLSLLSQVVTAKPQPKLKSWRLPYHSRELAKGQAAVALLCLTVREVALFGHSALSVFELDKNKKLESGKVENLGFWPFADKKAKEDLGNKGYLLSNAAKDHFLVFEHGKNVNASGRHCVPITAKEKEKLKAIYEEKKRLIWTVGYNCNDLSSEAFEKITGIQIQAQSKNGICALPKTVNDSLKKYHATREPSGYFTYTPKDPSNIAQLTELEASKALKISVYQDSENQETNEPEANKDATQDKGKTRASKSNHTKFK